MAKRDIERELEGLGSVDDPAILLKALRDRVNLIVARAASRLGSLGHKSVIPDLLAAYDRQFVDGAKTDSQCWAKNALAKALKDLEWSESKPFVRGAQYQQWEPVWGGEADSAGTLRSICLLAIPFCNDLLRNDKLWILMRGLSDKISTVRLETARGLEQLEGAESALLLRLKARSGDRDLAVTGQVFESLLQIEKESAIPFLVEFITQRGEPDRDDETAEQAALVLGASRFESAVKALMECAENSRLVNLREVMLRALGLSRLDTAIEYLLVLIKDGRERDALAALTALESGGSSLDVAKRIKKAVEERASPAISEEWRRLFPSS